MKPGAFRTLALLGGIVLGALIPQAHVLASGIRWLVMAMLFLVFLQTTLSRTALHRSHAALLAANVLVGLFAWGAGWVVGGRDIALAAFFAGITPTATAAPVITSFLRGRVDYVVAAFVLTNVVISALLPLLLPLVLGRPTPDAFRDVLGSVLLVVFVPIALAGIVRLLHPRATEWPARWRNVSFAMWVGTIFLITANATHFMRTQGDTPPRVLGQIALVSFAVCALNFALGRRLGGRAFRREASQALGQKNNSLTIYLALAYTTPVIALGPTLYVIWHNLWNTWQLHQAGRREP